MDVFTKLKKLFLTSIFICASVLLFRPFVVSQLIARGDGFLGFNMHKDAIREYKKALILNPDNMRARNWLGYAYSSMGDIDNAIETYKKAIELNSYNIVACFDLGMIYAKEKKFELASSYFLKGSLITEEETEDMGIDYAFYHTASARMLAFCRERLEDK